jgi:hypothetical protein
LAHGATGILESYFRENDSTKVAECINQLSKDWFTWPAIREVLLRKKEIRGHLPCFCSQHDKIRRCHPEALKGLRKLWDDVRFSQIALP